MRSLMIAAVILAGSSLTYAEPISIASLSWQDTHKEMAEILKKRDFVCPETSSASYEPPISVMCERTEPYATIYIYDKKVDFGCAVFSLCQAPLKEVAKNFVDTGKVKALTPKMAKTIAGRLRLEYCGSGDEGDTVCLEGNPENDNLASVVLYKSAFGQQVGFD